jgi:hypothetical protein
VFMGEGGKVKIALWEAVEANRVVRHWWSHSWLTDGSEVVSLMRRLPFNPRKIPGTHFCYGLSQPLGHWEAGRIRSIKNAMTSLGIESTTFQLVAWCLNQRCKIINIFELKNISFPSFPLLSHLSWTSYLCLKTVWYFCYTIC